MRKPKLISVIIPCYNQGKFLEEAVKSVINQKYNNYEIIIINDGSTENETIEILKQARWDKTKIVNTKNQGLSKTRNYGYKLSKGEYIQFLDADDYLLEDKFNKQIRAFEINPSIDICYSDFEYHNEITNKMENSYLPTKLSEKPLEDLIYGWQRNVSIPIHCGLFKSSVWGVNNPFLENFDAVEDWIMWIELAYNNKQFYYIDEQLVAYRIHNQSMSKNLYAQLYWVGRAQSYIAENFINKSDIAKFNKDSIKYLEKLIDIFFLNNLKNQIKDNEFELLSLNNSIQEFKTEISQKDREYRELLNSTEYIVGKKLLKYPRRINNFIKKYKNG